MQVTAGNPRTAIYGRHSTDKQNPSSSADQVAACPSLVQFLERKVVQSYIDPETSGYRRDRPALKRLLRDIAEGRIDIVFAESHDRLARDPEDVTWIGKNLRFDRMRPWTIAENEIDDVKFAVAGMLGSLFLSQLRQKVHRGLSAAVLAGRFAGGRAYGYRKVTGFDDRGRPLTGVLEIVPEEADKVQQIFHWFAAGVSSIEIATRLNLAGIPPHSGGNGTPQQFAVIPKSSSGSSIIRSIAANSSGADASGARTRNRIAANGCTGYARKASGSASRFPI